MTETASSLIKFDPQCCDATMYLQLGKACAVDGVCYDEIRTMGSIFWFSTPYLLDVSENALILINLILTLMSSILATLALRGLFSITSKRGLLLQILVSTIIHVTFLFPVLWTSLSDTPATLFILISTWILILSSSASGRSLTAFIFFSGLFLGLAAIIRAFYLYPALIVIGIYLVFFLANKKRRLIDLVFLVSIIPIAFQFYATWEKTGSFSYIDSGLQSQYQDLHLNSAAIGYDTVITYDDLANSPNRGFDKKKAFYGAKGHYWDGACDYVNPIITALKTNDFRSAYCTISGRVNFYFGSHSPSSYMESEKNRSWSNLILFLNSAAFFGFIAAISSVKNRLKFNASLSLLLFSMAFSQSLLPIPEQRFFIYPLIFIWTFFILGTILKTIEHGSGFIKIIIAVTIFVSLFTFFNKSHYLLNPAAIKPKEIDAEVADYDELSLAEAYERQCNLLPKKDKDLFFYNLKTIKESLTRQGKNHAPEYYSYNIAHNFVETEGCDKNSVEHVNNAAIKAASIVESLNHQ